MELEFDITQSFNEDMAKLPILQQSKVQEQINLVSSSLLNGQKAFKENSSIPYIFNLKGGLDSSLFLIKVDQNNRIVAAIDEDPIFDKISLTLFRLVDKIKLMKFIKKLAKRFIQKQVYYNGRNESIVR